MDKGIRPAANAKFVAELPSRETIGNTAFRKNVMFYLMEEYGCTNPAAATHYNHAFKQCKAAHPDLVGPILNEDGSIKVPALGRPEGKNNGGRKKKVVETAPEAAAEEGTAETAAEAPAPEPEPEVQLFTVRTKKAGKTVAEGLTKEAAEALVAKAKAAKKAALEIA